MQVGRQRASPVASTRRKRGRSLSAGSRLTHSTCLPAARLSSRYCCIKVVLPNPAAARIRIRRVVSVLAIWSSSRRRGKWLSADFGLAYLVEVVLGIATSSR
ncbi:hypothetical protein D9M71_645910 [compost metagenome]